MAKLLAVVTVSKTSMSSVQVYPACNITKACQCQYILGLWHPRWDYEEEAKVYCGSSLYRWLTGGWHLFGTNNIKAKVHQSIWDVLCRSGEWKVPYYSLYKTLGIGTEDEVWEVIALEVRVDGWRIRHFFRDNSGHRFWCYGTRSYLLVTPSSAFVIVSGLPQRLVQ